jgi:hypothetical protein
MGDHLGPEQSFFLFEDLRVNIQCIFPQVVLALHKLTRFESMLELLVERRGGEISKSWKETSRPFEVKPHRQNLTHRRRLNRADAGMKRNIWRAKRDK